MNGIENFNEKNDLKTLRCLFRDAGSAKMALLVPKGIARYPDTGDSVKVRMYLSLEVHIGIHRKSVPIEGQKYIAKSLSCLEMPHFRYHEITIFRFQKK